MESLEELEGLEDWDWKIGRIGSREIFGRLEAVERLESRGIFGRLEAVESLEALKALKAFQSSKSSNPSKRLKSLGGLGDRCPIRTYRQPVRIHPVVYVLPCTHQPHM